MGVVILRWNPEVSSYRMEHFQKVFEHLREGASCDLDWSVWDWERVHAGDRFFLVRVGQGATGIVMSGWILSEPEKDEDWSGRGRTTYYCDLTADVVVDTEAGPRLSVEELEEKLPVASVSDFVWGRGHSGVVLSDEEGAKLELLWFEFLYENFVLKAPAPRNYAVACERTSADGLMRKDYDWTPLLREYIAQLRGEGTMVERTENVNAEVRSVSAEKEAIHRLL